MQQNGKISWQWEEDVKFWGNGERRRSQYNNVFPLALPNDFFCQAKNTFRLIFIYAQVSRKIKLHIRRLGGSTLGHRRLPTVTGKFGLRLGYSLASYTRVVKETRDLSKRNDDT